MSLVYAGRTGVSFSEHSGGGGNYLCMPDDPQYLSRYYTDLEYKEGAMCTAQNMKDLLSYLDVP